MASQQQPARPWFRLASLAGRPAQQPTPAPEPPAAQPRSQVPRPTFRPVGQTQPQEPGQQGIGVSSVPTSPVRRTSVPSSPVQRTTAPTISPPKPQVPAPTAPTASLPTSPIRRPRIGSVTTSPVKPIPLAAPVTTSPPKPAPYTAPVITAQRKPVPTTFSVPTSPTIRTSETVTQRMPSPPSPKHSPRTIKPGVPSPVQSPKQKPTAPPPSPLSLPPPQLKTRTEHEPKIPREAEKGVLVQQTIEKPKTWPTGTEPRKDFEETRHRPGIAHHHDRHEVGRDGEAKKKSHHLKKFSSDSDEGGMRIITIAGENKGAFMEVIKSPMRGNSSHTLHKTGYTTKTESDGTAWKSFSSTSSDEEGKSKKKDKSHDGKAMVSPHLGAFMNSNVQGVNNSIVFNSSYSHHDPGVHLAFSRQPSGDGFHVIDNSHNH